MQVLVPNALQPAEVDEVILCKMMGRAIVLVREDQLSLAIGRRGQNVRLASKLCKWDIEIMTQEELQEQIERAVIGYSAIEGISDQLAEQLVGEGFLSYDDLSVIEPDDLIAMSDSAEDMETLTEEQVDVIVEDAETRAEEAEKAAAEERRQQRERDRLEKEKAAAMEAAGITEQPAAAPEGEAPAEEATAEEATAEEATQTEAEPAAEEASTEAGATEEPSAEEASPTETEDATATSEHQDADVEKS